MSGKQWKVILVGASVGKAWDVPGFPERVNSDRYRLTYMGVYQFDKSEAVDIILTSDNDLPDAVVVKECAAYFPGDIRFAESKQFMKRWIRDIRDKGITPIPATVAPVTREHDDRFKTHNPMKRIVKRMLGISMMTRIERICEYNDWIAAYAETEGFPLLDLEGALRNSDVNRFLRDDLTSGDGLHLNRRAYRLLDATLERTLNNVFSDSRT